MDGPIIFFDQIFLSGWCSGGISSVEASNRLLGELKQDAATEFLIMSCYACTGI